MPIVGKSFISWCTALCSLLRCSKCKWYLHLTLKNCRMSHSHKRPRVEVWAHCTKATSTVTPPTYFDHEDGDSMYLENTSNTAHLHNVHRLKGRISINNKLWWKPKISYQNCYHSDIQQSEHLEWHYCVPVSVKLATCYHHSPLCPYMWRVHSHIPALTNSNDTDHENYCLPVCSYMCSSWRRHVPSKCRLTFNRLYSLISQKIALFKCLLFWAVTLYSSERAQHLASELHNTRITAQKATLFIVTTIRISNPKQTPISCYIYWVSINEVLLFLLHTACALTCTYIHIYNIIKFLHRQKNLQRKQIIQTVGMTTPNYLISDQVSVVELPTVELQVPQWVYLLSWAYTKWIYHPSKRWWNY